MSTQEYTQIIDILDQIHDFALNHRQLYIYGAGKYGKLAAWFLKRERISIAGFCVTEKSKNEQTESYTVFSLDELLHEFEEELTCGFIVALKKDYQAEVKELTSALSRNFETIFLPESFFGLLTVYYNNVAAQAVGSELSFSEWIKKLYTLSSDKCIYFRREGGIGDILTFEPVLRKLKKMGYKVILETRWHELFYYNQSVDITIDYNNSWDFIKTRCFFVDFTFAHENHLFSHMLDGYLQYLRPALPILDLDEEERVPLYDPQLIHTHNSNGHKICLNNEASYWDSRIYPPERMKEFARYLLDRGYEIYEIGSDERNYLGVGKNCFDLDLHNTVKLMETMDLYVGLDNGLMHLAQSIHLPIFVLFGCTCPNFRIHDWATARVMWKNADELSCAACHHRRFLPCNRTYCSRDKVYCLDWSVEEVIEAFHTKQYNDPPYLNEKMFIPLNFVSLDE